jgi:hypothetical protein
MKTKNSLYELYLMMDNALSSLNESTNKLRPLSQLEQLALRLPKGYKGRSIHSAREIVLIELESRRRAYNRVNRENLDLYTFTSLQSGMDVIKYLDFKIVTFDRLEHYRKSGNYNNNKQVNSKYLGTYQYQKGEFVGHLFERL